MPVTWPDKLTTSPTDAGQAITALVVQFTAHPWITVLRREEVADFTDSLALLELLVPPRAAIFPE